MPRSRNRCTEFGTAVAIKDPDCRQLGKTTAGSIFRPKPLLAFIGVGKDPRCWSFYSRDRYFGRPCVCVGDGFEEEVKTIQRGEDEMLILTRRLTASLKIGDDVTVTILGVKGRQVRIGVSAPKSVPLHREELYQRIREGTVEPARLHELKEQALAAL